MDILYIFRHSKHGDEELRFSLRSVAQHLTWVRKVWVFGDRPTWLADETSLVEHVPHERVAWIGGYKTPVVNTFVMMYLAALLPELDAEYLWFCDDYILLKDLTPELARRQRIVQDLANVKSRGKGLYKETLWRTYDLLKRLGYEGLNYEVHLPVHLTKRRVLEAVREFRDFMTEDRFYGPLAQMAVLNHARKREGFPVVQLSEEAGYAGFHKKAFTYADIVAGCAGKTFLNFDDEAFNDDLRRYLAEQFSEPCVFEREFHGTRVGRMGTLSRPITTEAAEAGTDQGVQPTPVGPHPGPLPDGEGAAGVAVAAGLLVDAGGSQSHWQQAASGTRGGNDGPLGVPSIPSTPPPLDPARCVVLVPHCGHIVARCETGLQQLERRGYTVRRVPSDSGLDETRSRLASDALTDGFAETFWIDADIGFDHDDVERLRRFGLPLSCAVYPKKGQRSLAVQVLPDTKQLTFGRKGGLTELLYAEAGFLHVRREVYETLASQLSLPTCQQNSTPPWTPYFQPFIRPWKSGAWYLTEGFAFCHRARQCGIPIVADTTIRIWHVGEYAFGWEEAGLDRQRFATFDYRLGQTAPA
jgi:hypothetical protein